MSLNYSPGRGKFMFVNVRQEEGWMKDNIGLGKKKGLLWDYMKSSVRSF